MYTYFVDVNTDVLGAVVSTPAVGIVNNQQFELNGRVISALEIESIRLVSIFSDGEFDVVAKVHLAPKLTQQLQLKDSENAYNFSVNAGVDFQDDIHFSIEVRFVDGSEVRLGYGFIQRVNLPKKVVLIVGSPRSGTSALGKALRKALGANAHGESHVIEGVNRLVNLAADFFQKSKTATIQGNLVNAIPQTLILAEQLTMLRRIYRKYYGDLVHLDKTPGIPMLESLPLAILAWPNARVVFCKRRGMENISSRLSKFPLVPFGNHLRQWRQSFVMWRTSKMKINKLLKHNNWFIEVDQFDMAIKPEEITRSVASLLDLNSGQQKNLLAQLGSDDRPEQTSIHTSHARSIEQFGWTAEQIQKFKNECGKEMLNQSYSYDEKYYMAPDCVAKEEC